MLKGWAKPSPLVLFAPWHGQAMADRITFRRLFHPLFSRVRAPEALA